MASDVKQIACSVPRHSRSVSKAVLHSAAPLRLSRGRGDPMPTPANYTDLMMHRLKRPASSVLKRALAHHSSRVELQFKASIFVSMTSTGALRAPNCAVRSNVYREIGGNRRRGTAHRRARDVAAQSAGRQPKDPKSYKSMDEARAQLMQEHSGPTMQTFLNWLSQGLPYRDGC